MPVMTQNRGLLAEEIMATLHTDACYLFDLYDDGMLIASRAPACKSPQSESICTYFEPTVWDEIRTHLLSYSMLPMVVDSRLGTGIVLPTLVPTASLGILCIPDIPRDLLIRLAKSGACGEFVCASSTSDIRARMSKRTNARMKDFEAWMSCLKQVFYDLSLPESRDVRKPINALLHDRMLEAARYVGCPITWQDRSDLVSYGDFDYPLFVAFFVTVLCLTRRVASDRSVCVSLGMTSFGGTISVTMAKREELRVEEMQELLCLRGIAERKNILFDYAEEEGTLCIRLSPVSKDWSYLELKAPDAFAWIDERK